jgi:hypothetical protein
MTDSIKNSVTSLLTTGLIVTATFVNASTARASDTPPAQDQDPYFQIQSITVEEIPDTADDNYKDSLIPAPADAGGIVGGIGQVTGAINQIVNTGKAIWAIIEANKPVSNVSTDIANAIPQASSTWDSLEGWSAPQTHLFHVNYKNGFGKDVIDFTYRVIYIYAGNVGGKGHFLNGVAIVPADLTVAWGYTFNAQAKVPSVTNAGSVKDPIAAMEIQMQWSVSTAFKINQQTQNYYVRGDGVFESLN